jgi:DNA-binding NarL/FixJ family response regulator
MAITLVLADDYSIVREGLKALLEKNTDINIVGEAEDGLSVVQVTTEKHPDIVIMDIRMPGLNGIDAIKPILDVHPETEVIILSMHKEEKFIRDAFLAGAKGYLLKDNLFDELLPAIYAVNNGQCFLSQQLSQDVVDPILNNAPLEIH